MKRGDTIYRVTRNSVESFKYVRKARDGYIDVKGDKFIFALFVTEDVTDDLIAAHERLAAKLTHDLDRALKAIKSAKIRAKELREKIADNCGHLAAARVKENL